MAEVRRCLQAQLSVFVAVFGCEGISVVVRREIGMKDKIVIMMAVPRGFVSSNLASRRVKLYIRICQGAALIVEGSSVLWATLAAVVGYANGQCRTIPLNHNFPIVEERRGVQNFTQKRWRANTNRGFRILSLLINTALECSISSVVLPATRNVQVTSTRSGKR